MEDAILHVGDFIKRYKSLKSIIIKFTLGKYSSEFGFERHLFHEGNYTKILNLRRKKIITLINRVKNHKMM